jgi:hypothetical protein
LTPEDCKVIDGVARGRGTVEQLSVQQIDLALDQARFIGDL